MARSAERLFQERVPPGSRRVVWMALKLKDWSVGLGYSGLGDWRASASPCGGLETSAPQSGVFRSGWFLPARD